MKYQILGAILLVLALGGLYLVFEANTDSGSPTVPTISNNNDSALKSLSIQ